MYAFYEYLSSEAMVIERDSVTRHWHQDFFIYQLPPDPDYPIIIFKFLENATMHGNKWEKFPNRKLFCIFWLNTFE
jgi:hypothetical protein